MYLYLYHRKLHLPYFWFILFLRVRECELIIKMESLDHSAELGLQQEKLLAVKRYAASAGDASGSSSIEGLMDRMVFLRC